MFKIIDQDVIDWFENLETYCQNKIYDKKELWFHNNLTRDDIEQMLTPCSRSYKSGKNILIKM